VLTLTLLILAAPPARSSLPNRVSVFVIDKSGGDSGGVEARLTNALDDEKVSLADIDSLFTPSSVASAADKALADAKVAYDNLDYDAALAKYQEALDTMVKSPLGASSKQLAEAHQFIAIIALQNGGKTQAKKAQEGFVRALVHDPSIQVDAKTYGADVKKVFDKAVAEVAKLGKSQLKVDSTPGGADATLAGRLLGTTPLEPLDLPVGQHLVTFARPGYEPAAVVVELTRDGAKANGTLSLVSAYADQRTTAGAIVNAIGSGKVPVGARGLAEKMKTRFVLIGNTSGGETTLELWDVESGSQLNGLHVNDDGGYAKVAKKVKQFVASPSAIVAAAAEPVAEVKRPTEPGTDEPLYKKWWLWAAVGVVVVGGATAGGVAAANANAHPFNTVLLGSP
jgi:hypothetical protein